MKSVVSLDRYFFCYSVKAFLPKMFWDHHISAEVNKEHHQFQDTHHSTQKYIAHVVEICKNLLTHDGIYYDVAVSLRLVFEGPASGLECMEVG